MSSAVPFDQHALHAALGETRKFLQRTISGSSDSDSYGLSSIKCEGDKRSGTPSSPDKCFEFDFEDDSKRTSRSCKGKRYQEFMSGRKMAAAPKKSKMRTTSSSSSASVSSAADGSWFGHPKPSGLLNGKSDEYLDRVYANHMDDGSHPTAHDDNKFDANDFDLEEKIKALPERDLELYISRKRDTKKRKKVGKRSNKSQASKMAAPPPLVAAPLAKAKAETAQEAKERMMMVGSQKRKARKESITRREVTSITATVESVLIGDNFCNAANALSNINANGGVNDLLILATVAETMQ